MRNEVQQRAKVLLKATLDLLQKQNESIYVLNLLAEDVMYDGSVLSGSCLKDDIEDLLDELK